MTNDSRSRDLLTTQKGSVPNIALIILVRVTASLFWAIIQRQVEKLFPDSRLHSLTSKYQTSE